MVSWVSKRITAAQYSLAIWQPMAGLATDKLSIRLASHGGKILQEDKSRKKT